MSAGWLMVILFAVPAIWFGMRGGLFLAEFVSGVLRYGLS